jgi:NTE family protein
VGLVLGGGGARGSAHIGVIRALEEMRVPVDCVVGTSMGSLVGALYASGMSVAEMEETISGIDWDNLFNDATPRQDQPYRRKRDDEVYALFGPKIGIDKDASAISSGLVSGQKINFFFETLISERVDTRYFDRLPIPYRAVAADLVTGEGVVLEEGNLALAMRASMSVPAVFDPVVWENRLLVDGGIVDNLPVNVARDLGADVVIAVDVGAGGLSKDQINDVLSVVGQLVKLMIMSNVNAQRDSLTDTDVLVQPALGDELSSADFNKSAQGIEIGYVSTIAETAKFSLLSLSEADYAGYRATIRERAPSPPRIEFVELDNDSQFDDQLILRQLNIERGQLLNEAQLEADIRLIYGLGFLEMVRYEIVEEDGRKGLKLHVRQDTRGTRYLEWGLDLFTDDVSNGFNLRLGYLKTDIDGLGSEFRLAGQLGTERMIVADLYKYIDRRAKTFVLPRLFAENREFTEYREAEPVSTHRVSLYGADVAVGREFSRHAALSAGVRTLRGKVTTQIGDPLLDEGSFDGGEYFLDFTYDRLDDRYFPDNGNFARLSYVGSTEALGADFEFGQAAALGVTARTFGRHTLLGGIGVRATVDGTAPGYAVIPGGGLFQLSGYNPGQVAGQNFGIALASYQYRIVRSRLLPGRLGLSVEYGGVTDDWEDLFQDGVFHGSLFAGFNTPIGPAYLGYGFGEEGASRWFLRFGQVFGSTSIIR